MIVLRGIASEEEGRAAVREVSVKEIPFIKIWVDDRGGEPGEAAAGGLSSDHRRGSGARH